MMSAFTERTHEAFRAYYELVPKGRFRIEYTVRLNNPGRFDLPATRFESRPVARGSQGSLATLAGRETLVELRLSPEGNLSIWPTAGLVRIAPLLAGVRYDTRVD